MSEIPQYIPALIPTNTPTPTSTPNDYTELSVHFETVRSELWSLKREANQGSWQSVKKIDDALKKICGTLKEQTELYDMIGTEVSNIEQIWKQFRYYWPGENEAHNLREICSPIIISKLNEIDRNVRQIHPKHRVVNIEDKIFIEEYKSLRNEIAMRIQLTVWAVMA